MIKASIMHLIFLVFEKNNLTRCILTNNNLIIIFFLPQTYFILIYQSELKFSKVTIWHLTQKPEIIYSLSRIKA